MYGVAGFVLGVAFWHAVGFWDFVSEAVFSGPRTQEVRSDSENRFAASRNAFSAGSAIETGSIKSAPGNAARPAVPVSETGPKYDRRLDGSAGAASLSGVQAQAEACTTVALNVAGSAQTQDGCARPQDATAAAQGTPSTPASAAPASAWSTEIERNRINSIR
jgi:hypothetical protein